MKDSIGKYVQRKLFGIWWNWLISNDCAISFRNYYDCSDDEIIMHIKEVRQNPEILKEFTV